MSEKRNCPSCGTEMLTDGPYGFCPKCMAKIILGGAAGETGNQKEQEHQQAAPSPDKPQGTQRSTLEIVQAPETEGDNEKFSGLAGREIGRYKILELIGEGGFGEVYMAEQVAPLQRKVALKIIKAGMDSRQIIARFEAERQALALMDHPNIAKVLDAGTTETGRPYFVMELVRGMRITAYCDEKHLPTFERLKLFIEVCRAVQHAHQKGIIHRDIKPSNVLVTLHDGEPVPKVIDFGIAKALGQKLTDKTLFTGFAQLMGTPAYMSPEQAELSGLDIDTRSDIYSLGVLLYELLTGVTPFDKETLQKAALDEVRRMIRETDPPKPSTRLQTLGNQAIQIAKMRHTEPAALRRAVSGDLDWIVMKCLEKDRQRRYETANGLGRDLERFLGNEPVTARPPSRLYRFQKVVRRNKLAFAAAGVVATTLVVGLAISTWSLLRVRQEARTNQRVAGLLKVMLSSITPAVAKGQDTTLLRRVLDQTAEQVQRELANDAAVMAELQTTIGQAYSDLGDYQAAETNLVRAVALRRRTQPNSLELADSLDILTAPLWPQGKFDEAEGLERESLALRMKLAGKRSQEYATALNNLGVILEKGGKPSEAQGYLEEALALQQTLPGKDERRLAETATALSSVYWKQRQFDKAEALDRQALAVYRRIVPDELDPDLAIALNNLGTVLMDKGDFEGAIEPFRKALQIENQLFKLEHQDKAMSLYNLAKALWLHGDLEEAERYYRELLEVWPKLVGTDNVQVARTLNDLGTVLVQQKKVEQAVEVHRRALELYRKLHHPEEVVSLNNLANAFIAQEKYAEAETMLAETISLLKKPGNPPEYLATSLRTYSGVLVKLGRLEQAEHAIRDCLAICENDPSLRDNWRRFDAMSVLGGVLVLRTNLDAAEPLLVSGHEGLHKRADTIPAGNRPRLNQTFDRLVRLYEARGEPEKAAEWKSKLTEFEKPQTNAPPSAAKP